MIYLHSDCTTPLHLADAFYTLPMVKDFIIDVLLGSPHIEVSVCKTESFLENVLGDFKRVGLKLAVE